MKGYRFYAEPVGESGDKPTRRQLETRASAGERCNVVAAMVCNGWRIGQSGATIDTISALTFEPNSEVCGGGAHDEYLRERCTRISESLARKLHPRLFVRLDSDC